MAIISNNTDEFIIKLCLGGKFEESPSSNSIEQRKVSRRVLGRRGLTSPLLATSYSKQGKILGKEDGRFD